MKQIKQTQLEVLRDGQPDPDFQPTTLENLAGAAQDVFSATIGRVVGGIALQTKMAAYDAFMGTNYRTIRNELVRKKRNKEWEQKIGIVAIKR